MSAPQHQDWQAEFSAALLDPDRPAPQFLRAWNGSDIAKRFAVYRNNFAVNLVDGLWETFPVCVELVGDEFFRAMANIFVRANPPGCRILAEYGSRLPDFIGGFEPAKDMPYLADVARLEHARVRAFHAADAIPMTPADWAAIAPDRLERCVIETHPSAQILSLDHAAFSIWAAHQGVGSLPNVDPFEMEDVLAIRPLLDVDTLALPPGGAQFLGALAGGCDLTAAAAGALEKSAEFDLAANLAIVMQSGFAVSCFEPEIAPA